MHYLPSDRPISHTNPTKTSGEVKAQIEKLRQLGFDQGLDLWLTALDRVAKVREVSVFPDTYLQANAKRFAAMSEAEFSMCVADHKAITAAGQPRRLAVAR